MWDLVYIERWIHFTPLIKSINMDPFCQDYAPAPMIRIAKNSSFSPVVVHGDSQRGLEYYDVLRINIKSFSGIICDYDSYNKH